MSFKVEKLVITAIPHVVETWTKGFGFKLVEEEERKTLNKINLMVFPGTVLLSKPLYQSQKTDGQSGNFHPLFKVHGSSSSKKQNLIFGVIQKPAIHHVCNKITRRINQHRHSSCRRSISQFITAYHLCERSLCKNSNRVRWRQHSARIRNQWYKGNNQFRWRGAVL